MFPMFDPLYLIMLIPGLLIAGWASFKVKAAYNKYSKIRSFSGYSGASIARLILDRNGLNDVAVEQVPGHLSDHYDPRSRTLRLSPQVYQSSSIAALGIAAHEAGHALQHKTQYAPLQLRSFMVPVASFGSNFAWIIMFIGIFMASMGSSAGSTLIMIGVSLFGAAVAFTLVTLPVEFNASTRAKAMLTQYGIVSAEEQKGVSNVLNAAAMTYVAAAVTAVLQLLYWLIRLGLLGGDD
ncbi:zinc metallopeptidase [bacterium]|nr:zinc metallopeptidase [candidate division CSSED10-310 bacterium]